MYSFLIPNFFILDFNVVGGRFNISAAAPAPHIMPLHFFIPQKYDPFHFPLLFLYRFLLLLQAFLMIMQDGSVKMKGGTTKQLKNGDCVYMDGKMMTGIHKKTKSKMPM